MITQRQANYTLNVGLHVFILFTFLTVFFFLIASRLAKESINKAFGSVIETQTDRLLSKVDEVDQELGQFKVNWNEVDKTAKNIQAKSQGELPNIKHNNHRLKFVAIGMIVSLGLLLIALYVYFRFYLGHNVSLKHIFVENLVIFIFIGLVEYMFFMHIAKKYIPVSPAFVSTTVLNRIKYQLGKSMVNE